MSFCKNKKKSQGALEFLFILFFLLTIISIIMVSIGKYSMDVQKQKEEKVVKDFADNILIETDIATKVTGGYYRNLTIPSYFVKRYNVTITSNYLILRDLENYGNDSEGIYYYPLNGDVNITYYRDNSTGEVYIVFRKKFEQDFDGLNLSKS
jgi:hypothetical protein